MNYDVSLAFVHRSPNLSWCGWKCFYALVEFFVNHSPNQLGRRWAMHFAQNLSESFDHSTSRGHSHTAEGEKEFLRIIDENQGIIHKICHSYANTREDRQDLYQEIVYQLWKGFPHFKGESKVSTWMHTVALRSAIMPYRHKIETFIESMETLPDQADNQDNVDEGHDDRVFEVFLKLGNFERAVLVLLLEGYVNREIAKMLRMSSDSLARRLRRVRRSIENHK